MDDAQHPRLNVWRPCKDKPNKKLMRRTLSLVRELVHQTFSEPRVTQCIISIRPSTGNHLRLSIYTNGDAFARIFGPASRVLDLIMPTCRFKSAFCGKKDRIHREDMRVHVHTYKTGEWCAVHAKVEVVRGWFEICSAVLEVCDALIPPRRMRLELHGRLIRHRQPIRSLTLRVGDAVVVGNLYELPPPRHSYQAVKPLILYRGIPVGPCSVRCQFNVLTGVHRLKSSEWMDGLNVALMSRIYS